MRIVNLTQSREWYSDIEMIKVEEGVVFFAVQVKEGEKYFYEVKKRDIETNEEKIIWRYKIDEDSFYMQKSYIYEDELILMRLNLRGQLSIVILEKASGKFIKAENIHIGEIAAEEIVTINKRYFFVRGENKKEESMYYLCDIEEGMSYLVTTMKLIGGLPVGHGLMRQLPCFKHQGEEWIVFNECYMEDYEYEQIYDCIMAKNFEASQVRETEGLYIISLEKLVEGIKQREDIIPFKEVKRRLHDGWVRYLGIENGNIYYREKDFETQIESIYAMDMESLEEKVVCQINHQKLEGVLRYDSSQIYEDIKKEGRRIIKGHYGLEEQLEIPVHKRSSFEAYLENRYIITSWWWENEVNGVYEYKEFVGIQDQEEDKAEEMLVYEGQCYIQDDIVLIY